MASRYLPHFKAVWNLMLGKSIMVGMPLMLLLQGTLRFSRKRAAGDACALTSVGLSPCNDLRQQNPSLRASESLLGSPSYVRVYCHAALVVW